MRRKVLGLLIVCLIGGVTTVVLYSPAALVGPQPRPPALPSATSLAPVGIDATPATTAASMDVRSGSAIRTRRELRSAAVRVDTIASPTAESQIAHRDEPPSLIAKGSFAGAVPLATPTGGIVPTPAPAAAARRGPFEVAGHSIGAAFATTGRSVGTAFKRVF